MPRYLIIDTETSGLFDFRKPADHEGQPRLAEFSAIEADENLNETGDYSALVKPDGWEISPEVTAINGLTTERCEAEGVPLELVLAYYTARIHEGYVVVAFNAQYDTKVVRGELRRLGLPDLFEVTPNICAMRACGGIGIEKAGAKKGGFPKLTDAYRHFFHTEMANAHSAGGDVRACFEVFRKLMAIGAAPPAQIHYAKNRPEAA